MFSFKQYWYTRALGSGLGTFAKSSSLTSPDGFYNAYCNYMSPFLSTKDRNLKEFPHQNIYYINKANELVFGKSVYLGSTQDSANREGLFFYHALIPMEKDGLIPGALFLSGNVFKTSIDLKKEDNQYGKDLPHLDVYLNDFSENLSRLLGNIPDYYYIKICIILQLIISLEIDKSNYQIFIKSTNADILNNIILCCSFCFPVLLSQEISFISHYYPPQELLYSNIKLIGITPNTETNQLKEKIGKNIFCIDIDNNGKEEVLNDGVTEFKYIRQVLANIKEKDANSLIAFIDFLTKANLSTFSNIEIFTELFLVVELNEATDFENYLQLVSNPETKNYRFNIWNKLNLNYSQLFKEFVIKELTIDVEVFNRELLEHILVFCYENEIQDHGFFMNLFDNISHVYGGQLVYNDFLFFDKVPHKFHESIINRVLINIQGENGKLIVDYFYKVYDNLKLIPSLIRHLKSLKFEDNTYTNIFIFFAQNKKKVEFNKELIIHGIKGDIIPVQALEALHDSIKPDIFNLLLNRSNEIFKAYWSITFKDEFGKVLSKNNLESLYKEFYGEIQSVFKDFGFSLKKILYEFYSYLGQNLSFSSELFFLLRIFDNFHHGKWQAYLENNPELILYNYDLFTSDFNLPSKEILNIVLASNKEIILNFFQEYSHILNQEDQDSFLRMIDVFFKENINIIQDETVEFLYAVFLKQNINPLDYLHISNYLFDQIPEYRDTIANRISVDQLNNELDSLLNDLMRDKSRELGDYEEILLICLKFYNILYQLKDEFKSPGCWLSEHVLHSDFIVDKTLLTKNPHLLMILLEYGRKNDQESFFVDFFRDLPYGKQLKRIYKKEQPELYERFLGNEANKSGRERFLEFLRLN